MSDCCVNSPMRLLRGVTRTVTLTIKDASGVPLDLSAVELTVEVIRDGSADKYVPTIAVEGEAHNLIVFTWPADKQKVGLHTIDVRGDFGVTGVSRTNWHGPDGIVIVEWARDTSAREVADLSVEEVSMTGTMETAAAASGGNYYVKPEGGIPASDMTEEVQHSLALADSALQSFTEHDPTVPAWAKAENKPSYTPQEVGALPADTHIPADQVQSDWSQSDDTAVDYIKNKPSLLEAFVAVYGTTTYAVAYAAYNAGKVVTAKRSNTVFHLAEVNTTQGRMVFFVYDKLEKKLLTITVDADGWTATERFVSNFDGQYSSLDNRPALADAVVLTGLPDASMTTRQAIAAIGLTVTAWRNLVNGYYTQVVYRHITTQGSEYEYITADVMKVERVNSESDDIYTYELEFALGGYVYDVLYDENEDEVTVTVTAEPSLASKADKVSGATNNNFAALDSNGNLKDSGKKAGDFLTQHQAVTDNNPTLAWGTKSKVGTVGSTDIHVTMPANPNTDTQSDWNETDINDPAYIKNKPNIPAGVTPSSTTPKMDGTAAVGSETDFARGDHVHPHDTSKQDVIDAQHKLSYTLLSDTPTIPTVPDISTDITADASSDTKTASPKAVKTYVDGAIPTVPTISTDIQTDKASTTKTAAPSAVYNEVHPAFGSSQPAGGLLPNVLYKLGTLTGNVTISFAAASDATIENEYKFTFTAGAALEIAWPVAITAWAGNCVENGAPVITGGNYYLVSVEDGIAVIAEVEV